MSWKAAEELKVGDLVRSRSSDAEPWARIAAIRPYSGPLAHLGCFGLVETRPGVGFSLWPGQLWEVA